jgi:hypothetical protein
MQLKMDNPQIFHGHDHIMDRWCLLILNSTGAVILLDKSMRKNRSIPAFHQVGTVCGMGHMKFCDKNDQETHALTTEERHGPWHASNLILMPPTSQGPTKQPFHQESTLSQLHCHQTTQSPPTLTRNNSTQPTSPTTDTTDPGNMSFQSVGAFGGNMSKAFDKLELWHQRTGPSPLDPFMHPATC